MRTIILLMAVLLCVSACERKGPAPWFKVEVANERIASG